MAGCFQDRDLLRQIDEVNKKRIDNLEKENELLKQELALKDKIIEINQMEIDSARRSVNDMKEVADRAIKLADAKKPSLFDQYGPIAVIAIIIITIASVL